MKLDAKSTIEAGKAILGIELGSTRIKAVLIDQENKPIAQGSQAGGGAALQKQVEQDKGCKQPQENAAAEYHRCMRIVHQQVVQAGKVYIQLVQKFANIPHRSVYG